QSIELKADIFVGNSGNERMTVGLRSRSPANLIEMGAYNTNTADPRIEGPANPGPADPNFLPSKGYAYRLILFGDRAPDLLTEPNWQYFDLPIELDRLEDTDELVTIADIGAGWHTYTALITPTNVTLTMDLFRDGFRNTMRDEEGNIITGSGEAGVDAEVTWEISTTAAGFNSLRMGGPSGLSSAGSGAMGFDNVLLQLVDAAAPGNDADFDADGDVDGADFLTWQRNLGAAGALAQGDADGNGTIELADLDVWKQQFSAGAAVPALAAIPEPTTVALSALAILAGLAASRRR
ncbi:MAG TPA: PEP-CTERM sorting domain-containing protein, partial [Lacipirellula sp.]